MLDMGPKIEDCRKLNGTPGIDKNMLLMYEKAELSVGDDCILQAHWIIARDSLTSLSEIRTPA